MSFITPGTIAAVFSIIAALLGHVANGKISEFLMDPSTVQTGFTVISGVLALSAGVLKGVQAPATPAPAKV